jgi:hypothetical protein
MRGLVTLFIEPPSYLGMSLERLKETMKKLRNISKERLPNTSL